MNTAILFLGYPAAGKSTALKAAGELGIPTMEMSQVAAWKFEQFSGRQPMGDDLRRFGNQQRGIHGQGIFGHWAVKYVEDRLGDPDVFAVAGIRSPGEIETILREAGESRVFQIDAPFDARLERIQSRNRNGEEEFTADDLHDRDDEEKSWGAEACEELADEIVENHALYPEDVFRGVAKEHVRTFLRGVTALEGQ